MTNREKFLAAARSFIGFKEADGSHREIIDIYNSISPLPAGYKMGYHDPWCAAFVSAAGKLAELEHIVLPECSCPRMIMAYEAAGRMIREISAVQPGDLVMYDWDKDSYADHVGIIEEVGDKLKVIEGNLSDSVGYRLLAKDSPHIRCFCLPAFESAGEQAETKEPIIAPAQKAESAADESLRLPVLSQGSAGESVRAAQHLLIGRGCRCGPWGADGEFGYGTYGAVVRYQQIKNLDSDGVIGPITWRALLGL